MAEQPSLSDILTKLQSTLLPATTTSTLLPGPSDLSFERTLSRSLARQLDSTSLSILSLADEILSWGVGGSEWKGLDGEMIQEGEYRDVVGVVEGLLEGADESIEKAMGTGKYKIGTVGAVGAGLGKTVEGGKNGKDKNKPLPKSLTLASIPKPQLLFAPSLNLPRPPIDLLQAPSIPTEPSWTPHSIPFDELPPIISLPIALAQNLTNVPLPPSSTEAELAEITYPAYAHPYQARLDSYQAPSTYFEKPTLGEGKGDGKWDEVPYEWIGDEDGVKRLVEEIEGQDKKELAVDLEHHETRSWGGVTSLMQLSTRDKDYVIDVLAPSVRSSVHLLNKFFANAEWIKVFHGAYSDVIWLQRDLGLYIVGLFDTYCATKVLEHQQHSLASLLLMFTDFVPDKRYQLADWRIRPIPEEMLRYARADTHFLLDIYDHLRIALHALPSPTESLTLVISQSLKVSSATFSLSPYSALSPGAPLSLLSKFSAITAHFAPEALSNGWREGQTKYERLVSLCGWRENEARSSDENVQYVLTDRAIEVLVHWVGGDLLPGEDGDGELVKVLGNNVKGGISPYLRGMEVAARERRGRMLVALGQAKERVDKARKKSVVVKMDVDEEGEQVVKKERGNEAKEPTVAPLEGLWEKVPVASTSVSTLFGKVKKAVKGGGIVAGLKASGSAFFGQAGGKGKEKEVDRVDEIHRSLVLGGGLSQSLQPHSIPTPIIVDAANFTDPPPFAESKVDATDALSIDHSFVPFDERAPKPEPSTTVSSKKKEKEKNREETIVVSQLPGSGSGGKKRRRPKNDSGSTPAPAASASASTEAPTPKAKKIKPTPGSITPHDYSSQPSILDASQTQFAHAGTSKKEKKEQKKKGTGLKKAFEIDTSEFRREPRVNNASKKGLVSKSFGSGGSK